MSTNSVEQLAARCPCPILARVDHRSSAAKIKHSFSSAIWASDAGKVFLNRRLCSQMHSETLSSRMVPLKLWHCWLWFRHPTPAQHCSLQLRTVWIATSFLFVEI